MDAVILFLTKFGLYGVLAAAFFEAIIFPPPVDIILIPVMLANRDKAIFYSVLTVIVSMFGAAVGYRIGKAAGRPLLERLFKPERVESVKHIYDEYGAAAIITSAFTPIPYEAYTLSAGLFRMNFKKFLAAAFASRLLRYIPQGIIIQLFGRALEDKTVTGIGLFIIALIIMLAVFIVIKNTVSKQRKS